MSTKIAFTSENKDTDNLSNEHKQPDEKGFANHGVSYLEQSLQVHEDEIAKQDSNPLDSIVNSKKLRKLDYHALKNPEVLKLREEISEMQPHHDGHDALSKRIAALTKGKIQRDDYLVHTVGEASDVARLLNRDFTLSNGNVFTFNGVFWQNVKKETLERFGEKVSLKCGVPSTMSQHHKFKKEFVDQLISSIPLVKDIQGERRVALPLENGLFVLKNGKHIMEKFDKKDFFTYRLKFGYDPAATCPIWQKHLDKVLPDADAQKVLQEYIGYILVPHNTGNLKLERILMLFGSGSNGKSVVFEVIQALIGAENITHFTLKQLTESRGIYRAEIENKILNMATEIPPEMRADVFKKIASGEPVDSERKYEPAYQIYQYAKMMFSINEMIVTNESTASFIRRFLIIPFDVLISAEEADTSLHGKIINSELSGVFNWILVGLNRLIEQDGFTSSKVVDDTVNKFDANLNSVNTYLDEERWRYDSKKESPSIRISDFYSDYREFCVSHGFHPFNMNKFKSHTERKGFRYYHSKVGTVTHRIIGTLNSN